MVTRRRHRMGVAAIGLAALAGLVAARPAPGPGLGGAVERGAAAAVLVRGPYLQRAAPTTAILRWRTSEPTDAWLVWGVAVDQLDHLLTDDTATTEHRLALSGLAADTTYYYAIGSSAGTLAGGDSAHSFRTPPLPGARRPLRLWIVGDTGNPTAGQAAVRDAYLTDPGAGAIDAWLLLGDNAYYLGTDEQYQAGLFSPYAGLLARTFLWPTLGNHDAYSSDSATQSGPFFADFSLPRQGEAGGLASGTEAYYSFDLGNVHAVCLDTADSDLAAGSPMLVWLAADLAATSQPWIVAFFHHPPYTHGSHDSDAPYDSGGLMFAVRGNVLPILEAGGVALVVSGHSHDYERSFLLTGHYGTSDTLDPSMVLDAGDGDPASDGAYVRARRALGGTVYAVVGAGSSSGGGALDHPAMAVSTAELGSLVLDVADDQLSGRYLDSTGLVRDRFTIVDGVHAFADGFESGGTSRW